MRRLLALLLTLVAFVAACGDDDDDTDTAGGDDAAVTTTTAGDEEGAAGDEEGAAGDEEGAAGDEGDTKFSGKGSGDYCELIREYEDQFDDAFQGSDSASLREDFAAASEAIERVASEAPDEIENDVQVVLRGFTAFAKALQDADYDMSKVDQESLAAINTDEFEQASNRLDEYGEQVCGVEDDDTTPTTTG